MTPSEILPYGEPDEHPDKRVVSIRWICDVPYGTDRYIGALIDEDDAYWVGLHDWCVDLVNGRPTIVAVDPDHPDHRMVLARSVLDLADNDPLQALHKGGDWSDCRKSRLIAGVPAPARKRGRSNNTSGYKGVSLNKPTGTWRAMIYYNGKQKTIGYYRTAEDAHMARLAFMQRPKLTVEKS